ncbi:MAG: hypothetical protein K2J87_08655, partial [Muribaculaceae bacterium]|nr:hypothetical protein [Muribaculaceae bacterium]
PVSESPRTVSEAPAAYNPSPQAPKAPQPPQPAQRHHTPPEPQRPMGKPRTFRLSDSAHTESTSLEPRNTHVTIDSFMQAWNKFIQDNSDQYILTSAMRKSKITMGGENEFHILVEHPAQQQAFESSTKLVTFLRDTLKNDFIALKAELDTSIEVVKMLPPKEFIAKAIAQNPALGEFLKNIEAEIN